MLPWQNRPTQWPTAELPSRHCKRVCLTRQPARPSGTLMAQGCPTRQPMGQPITAPLLRQHMPHPAGMLHRLIIPPPNPPIDTTNLPFVNLSFVVASMSTVKVMVILVATVLTTSTSVAKETTTTPLVMFRLWEGQSFPLDTATGPCMPTCWVPVALT